MSLGPSMTQSCTRTLGVGGVGGVEVDLTLSLRFWVLWVANLQVQEESY